MFKKMTTSAAVAMMLTLSACGGGGGGGGSAGSDSAATDQGIASLDSVAPEADSDQSAGESSDEPSEADLEEAYAKYNQCLEDIGLGVLAGDGGGDGVSTEVVIEGDVAGDAGAIPDDAFERMEEECDPLLSDLVGEFEMSPEQEAAQRDADLEFARCMREEGIDIGDPGAGGDQQTFELPEDFDIDKMNEVSETCSAAYDALDEMFDGES